MESPAPTVRPRRGLPWAGGVFAPLSLVAYCTWAAVTIEAVDWAAVASGAAGECLGLACLVLFLALFVLHVRWVGSDDAERRRGACARLTIAQGVAAVAAIWLLGNGLLSILVIMVAAQIFAIARRATALAWLVTFNMGLAFCWLQWMDWTAAVISLLPVIAFESFAALIALYAVSAGRARDELARVNMQLFATQALLNEGTRSEERLKLSRELHDITGHKLTALKLNLARLARDSALAGREEVVIAKQLADELLTDIRAVVGELRKHDGIDLRAAVEALTAQLPWLRFEIDIPIDARVESVPTAEALLRCAQEGITNALRHGHPTTIAIECKRRGNSFELRVRDDGSTQPAIRFGNGLTGMQERLEAVGGSLRVSPAPGRGVELVASLPAGR